MELDTTLNVKGRVGRKVGIDQVMEHNIRETKDLMFAHGAYLTFHSAQEYSRAASVIKDNAAYFDCENKVRKESSKHKRRTNEDVFIVVDTLKKIEALEEISGRKHKGIGSIPKDPISAVDFNDLKSS